MLANRRDTPKRVAAYLKRGFGPYYLADDKITLEAFRRLHEEVKEHYIFEKKLMNLSVFGWGEPFDMDAVTTTMASDNTSYASWNVPRMVHLTSAGIRSFFTKLSEQTDDPRFQVEFVDNVTGLPAAQSKLDKVQQEQWIAWGML